MGYAIKKFPETMSSRTRIRKTFEFERTDRPPIGYDSNPGIDIRLKDALGIARDDDEALWDALGVDYRGIHADYTGPELFPVPKDRQVNQLEGSVTRLIRHASGEYWDFCDFPLKDAEDDTFYSFPVPNPDDFDYEKALDRAKSFGGKYALFAGNAGIPDVINSNGRIMGMEDALCRMAMGDAAGIDFIKRRASFQLGMMERLLDKCKGLIDFMWLGEDLGTQRAPMIGLKLYRDVIKPIHREFANLAAAHGVPVMIHTCGSSSWAYEDMIEIGIRGTDAIQPEAFNMSPEYLTEHFGGRLNFRGLISTTGALSFGSAEDVKRECERIIEMMKPFGGYHFAPSHQIQDNTPVENVISMYETAHAARGTRTYH